MVEGYEGLFSLCITGLSGADYLFQMRIIIAIGIIILLVIIIVPIVKAVHK